MKALITGATKGIGRAIAMKLGAEGYDLILVARNREDLEQFKKEMAGRSGTIALYALDCADKMQLTDFLDKLQQKGEVIDILVNNVGTFIPGSLMDEDDEAFEKQQALNHNAMYYLSKRIGKTMREARSGHIFNICSVASRMPVQNAGSYSVTKAAMLSLNHVLRQELAPYHVKVTAFLPGSTKTASWEGTTIPDEKFVQPGDIAEMLFTILNLSKGVNVDEVLITPLNF